MFRLIAQYYIHEKVLLRAIIVSKKEKFAL